MYTRRYDKVALTPRGLERGELWRLFTTNVVFTSPGEALFGMYLLYHFRVFERQRWGPHCKRKHSSSTSLT